MMNWKVICLLLLLWIEEANLSVLGNALKIKDEDGAKTSKRTVVLRDTISSCASEFTNWNVQVLCMTNVERSLNGVSYAYFYNYELENSAQGHSEDMAINDYFSHTTPENVTFYERITNAGYDWYYCGENIAAGQTNASVVINTWMSDSGHRDNILDVNYIELGVGYYYYASSTYGKYWTQDFGSRIPACGNALMDQASEQCDDGNTNNGDGCSSTCTIESGWTCTVSSVYQPVSVCSNSQNPAQQNTENLTVGGGTNDNNNGNTNNNNGNTSEDDTDTDTETENDSSDSDASSLLSSFLMTTFFSLLFL